MFVHLLHMIAPGVRNAYKAYSYIYHRQYESIDAYSTTEMLGMHREFMASFSKETGRYRLDSAVSNSVDVLFAWAKTSKEDDLVKSCVFHYELMYIRHFSEGNGLVARMWQTLLLMQSWFMPICMLLWAVVQKQPW